MAMGTRSQIEFIQKYAGDLDLFWHRVKDMLPNWKAKYRWPPRDSPDISVNTREQLERAIKDELGAFGCLSKATFDSVMLWGFGSKSGCSEQDVQRATKLAFDRLAEGRVAESAKELLKLRHVGREEQSGGTVELPTDIARPSKNTYGSSGIYEI